jgi:hypothetical protein
MQSKYDLLRQSEHEAQRRSQELAHQLEPFLSPLLIVLDKRLEKRLVRTMVQWCVASIRFSKSKQGLLQGSAFQSDHFLLEEAKKEVERLKAQGKRRRCLLDGRVIEKPASSTLEGLGPVLWSKAKRNDPIALAKDCGAMLRRCGPLG